MLSVPERIAQVARHIATHNAHGYSQNNRSGDGTTEQVTLSDGSKVLVHGGDYDCSEMVRVCVNAALSGTYRSPISYMWTGDEDSKLKAQGFTRMAYSASKVKRGDVLWVSGHTGIALGDGLQADAHGDEYGGITGPNRGDQTTREVEVRSLRSWDYIYRHSGSGGYQTIGATFQVSVTSAANIRTSPEIRPDNVMREKQEPSDPALVCDGIIVNADGIWGTYVAYSGKRRYIHVGERDSWVKME